jgi:hypothetical protein
MTKDPNHSGSSFISSNSTQNTVRGKPSSSFGQISSSFDFAIERAGKNCEMQAPPGPIGRVESLRSSVRDARKKKATKHAQRIGLTGSFSSALKSFPPSTLDTQPVRANEKSKGKIDTNLQTNVNTYPIVGNF